MERLTDRDWEKALSWIDEKYPEAKRATGQPERAGPPAWQERKAALERAKGA